MRAGLRTEYDIGTGKGTNQIITKIFFVNKSATLSNATTLSDAKNFKSVKLRAGIAHWLRAGIAHWEGGNSSLIEGGNS
jgi:hypothetical protein